MRSTGYISLFMFSLLFLVLSVSTQGKEKAASSIGRNMEELKLTTFPGLPECMTLAVESGDPATGPAILYVNTTEGCIIPWHWHTANENLMIVSGVAKVEMKNVKPLTLKSGGFVMLPSKHVHQFKCMEDTCKFFLYTDAPFDIHYVNKKGKEITPENAMKAVKETAATEMK